MPSRSDQKSGGPSAGGGGTSARSARMRLPRRCAAANSGGNVAAADMSSIDPAWMPPISGSVRTSTTRWPSLRATSGPMARSPIGPRTSGRGRSASRASASCPRGLEDPCPRRGPKARRDPERVALGQAAQPAPRPHGGAADRDRHQRVAEADLVAEVDGLGPAARGIRRARCRRHARRAPRCRAVRRGARRPRRTTTAGTSARGSGPPVSCHAAASPLMPPPTTTTERGVVMVVHPRGRRRRRVPR